MNSDIVVVYEHGGEDRITGLSLPQTVVAFRAANVPASLYWNEGRIQVATIRDGVSLCPTCSQPFDHVAIEDVGGNGEVGSIMYKLDPPRSAHDCRVLVKLDRE